MSASCGDIRDVGAGAVPPFSVPRNESWCEDGSDGAAAKEEDDEEDEEDEVVEEEDDEEVGAAEEGAPTYEYDASILFSEVDSGV